MKIAIILGTRPEIIKLCPIIRYCYNNKLDYFVIHSNQHYSKEMDEIFFKELDLPKPKYNLNVGSNTHGKQTGLMIQKIEEILLKELPTHVFVQGDTNTVLAGAIASSKLPVELVHIEAGLRSYDRKMPEEINRVVTDHISTILQCPTKRQKNILTNEGIDEEKIIVTGNTISDSIDENLILAQNKSKILDKLNVNRKKYFLLTIHRPSNVDSKENILSIIDGLKFINSKSGLNFIFPIHPRTKNNFDKFNIKIPKCMILINPVGYLDMLVLIKNSNLIFTDSGGIQEEACVLKVPTITLRENTERPETLDAGASILVGNSKENIIKGYNLIKKSKCVWKNPFGTNVTKKIFIKIN